MGEVQPGLFQPRLVEPFHLVLLAAPRTKKTHSRVVSMGKRCPTCKRGSIVRVLPSEAHEEWFKAALPQARLAWAGRKPLELPVQVAAVFYREKLLGDLAGFIQALGDLLEAAGILENDRLIASWDGSRLSKAAARIELVISERLT
jgi:hypothetical protein